MVSGGLGLSRTTRASHGPSADSPTRAAHCGSQVRGLLYVRETQIITLEGERVRMHFWPGARSGGIGVVGGSGGGGGGGGGGGSGGGGGGEAVPMGATVSLGQVLAKGGTRTSYDLDRDDSQGTPISARQRRRQRTV